MNALWGGGNTPLHFTGKIRHKHEQLSELNKYYLEPLTLPKIKVYKEKMTLDAGIVLACDIKKRR